MPKTERAGAEIFLSTLPVRGATVGIDLLRQGISISIHAPREGSDSADGDTLGEKLKFLSTLPVRGATRHLDDRQGREMISIHAPREGSDPAPHGSRHQRGISIHAPREGSDRRTSGP